MHLWTRKLYTQIAIEYSAARRRRRCGSWWLLLTAFSIIIHICLLYSLLASLSCYCCRHRHNRQLNAHDGAAGVENACAGRRGQNVNNWFSTRRKETVRMINTLVQFTFAAFHVYGKCSRPAIMLRELISECVIYFDALYLSSALTNAELLRMCVWVRVRDVSRPFDIFVILIWTYGFLLFIFLRVYFRFRCKSRVSNGTRAMKAILRFLCSRLLALTSSSLNRLAANFKFSSTFGLHKRTVRRSITWIRRNGAIDEIEWRHRVAYAGWSEVDTMRKISQIANSKLKGNCDFVDASASPNDECVLVYFFRRQSECALEVFMAHGYTWQLTKRLVAKRDAFHPFCGAASNMNYFYFLSTRLRATASTVCRPSSSALKSIRVVMSVAIRAQPSSWSGFRNLRSKCSSVNGKWRQSKWIRLSPFVLSLLVLFVVY